jgi:hypothetical protein
MTLAFIIIAVTVGGLLGLLLWSSGHRSSRAQRTVDQLDEEALTCRHAVNFQQVRQIFESTDERYLTDRLDRAVLRAVRKERRRIALKFLSGLQEDFARLQEVSSMVAVLSVEVEAHEEWRRFRLAAEFRVKYAVLRTKYAMGLAAPESFLQLAWMISSRAVELERAVSEIAASAALAQSQRPSAQA